MKNAINIKHYPGQLHIEYEDEGNIDSEEGIDILNYDGQTGAYSRQDWREDTIICQYDQSSQDSILSALSMTSNQNFFDED